MELSCKQTEFLFTFRVSNQNTCVYPEGLTNLLSNFLKQKTFASDSFSSLLFLKPALFTSMCAGCGAPHIAVFSPDRAWERSMMVHAHVHRKRPEQRSTHKTCLQLNYCYIWAKKNTLGHWKKIKQSSACILKSAILVGFLCALHAMLTIWKGFKLATTFRSLILESTVVYLILQPELTSHNL